MFKMPLHFSFRSNLHELWSKEKGWNQIENLILHHKPLEIKGQMNPNWGVPYIVRKTFWRGVRNCFHIFKINLIWKYMNVQSYGMVKVPILGLRLGSPREKWHLDVILVERHRIYYREGSGASSQRLRAM
jgi:hypothetical protein